MTSTDATTSIWAPIESLPVQIARYREDGVLRRFRASGAPMRTVFGSQIAVAFLVSGLGAVLVIGSATAAYDIRFPQSVGGVLVAWFACGVLFSALGLLLSCGGGTAEREAEVGQGRLAERQHRGRLPGYRGPSGSPGSSQ